MTMAHIQQHGLDRASPNGPCWLVCKL